MYLSQLSTEYVQVSVSAKESGVAVDPTSDEVQFAFPIRHEEVSGWTTGSWDSDGTHYKAQCLVGPSGTIQLGLGEYDVWVKVTDDPEIPARRTGLLTITI